MHPLSNHSTRRANTDDVEAGQQTLEDGGAVYQLQAETTYELGPEGVRCTITLPLSSVEERSRA